MFSSKIMKRERGILFTEAFDYHYGNKGSWKVYQMANGHLSQLPEPKQEDLNTYYPKTYYAFQQNKYQSKGLNLKSPKGMLWGHFLARKRGYMLGIKGNGLLALMAMWLLKSKTWLSARYVTDGTFLDFGCGSGDYLQIMQSVKWKNVTGIEISSGELKNEIDVIRSSHSIEHILEIEDFFSNAYNALKPGGQLLIDTPNAASHSLKNTQNYWYYLGMPLHIHIFSPASIKESLEEAGFENIRVSSYSRFQTFLLSYLAKNKKIESGITDSYFKNTTTELLWAGILSFIPFLISLTGNRGDCLIASAQKKKK
jgi:ubiquinone/menaquinone biosynthesis C-methylase UbiE